MIYVQEEGGGGGGGVDSLHLWDRTNLMYSDFCGFGVAKSFLFIKVSSFYGVLIRRITPHYMHFQNDYIVCV